MYFDIYNALQLIVKTKFVIHNLFRYEKLEEKTKAEAIEKERKEKEKGTFTNKEREPLLC